jgi:hypothetical protein
VFLADASYEPDDAARQFVRQPYLSFCTRPELGYAVPGLPLELTAHDCAYESKQVNLRGGAWPSTNWYVDCISGRDVFDLKHRECPFDMRWLTYTKSGSPAT